MINNTCRFCNSSNLESFVDLGYSPFANSLLHKKELSKKEQFFPLHVFVCKNCFLVQHGEFKSPSNIFTDYIYFSSYSYTWLKHAENYCSMMIEKYNLSQNKQVVEIASNDGYLLQFFKKKNIKVLGIEPAKNVANVAKEKKIPTITKFFSTNLALELINDGINADLIIGNNVLAHVPNLNDFIVGLKILLNTNGIITLEFPHLLQLIKQNQFDTIYHEHFSYFSFVVVEKILEYHGLEIFDVEELLTHGGSLRIFIKHKENNNLSISKSVFLLRDKEKLAELDKISTYTNFQNKIENTRQEICKFFKNVKDEKKIVVGYGAPAKGNTLLNFCKITSNNIKYTVDANPHKQGLFLPGTHIPIKSPDKILETKPDYIFILPWNIKDEIISQNSFLKKFGIKFVVPIPEVKIYS